MKVPVSISMDIERATELKDRARDSGETLSRYTNRLIEAGLAIERPSMQKTDGYGMRPPRRDHGGSAAPHDDATLDEVALEPNDEDEPERHTDGWPSTESLDGMSFTEKVFNCVCEEPRTAAQISGYTRLLEAGVQSELDDLLESGELIGRLIDGEWRYWVSKPPESSTNQ